MTSMPRCVCVCAFMPGGFIVEEVDTFGQVDAHGISYAQRFARNCSKLKYDARVLKLDHGMWSEISRVRLWIVG